MVFYSLTSSKNVFHQPHCHILKRMGKGHLGQFSRPEDAREQGYRACNCCSGVGTRLRKELGPVNRFCRDHDMTYYQADDHLYIQAPGSQWCIFPVGKSKSLILYHKNTAQGSTQEDQTLPGYHQQALRRKTILEYLEAIVSHDIYRQGVRKKAREQAQKVQDLWRDTRSIQKGKTNAKFQAGQLYDLLRKK